MPAFYVFELAGDNKGLHAKKFEELCDHVLNMDGVSVINAELVLEGEVSVQSKHSIVVEPKK